jgi:Acetyltransferase (GNAT) domain
MKLTFRATSPNDYRQVRAFLASAFQSNPDEPFLQRSQMEWKYWEPRPDWDGSRSYVLEREDRIVAHLSGWPLTFQTSGVTIRALHLIDWAANPSALGFGTLLLDKLATLVDCLVVVGGSDISRRTFPKLAFSPAGEYRVFARPLRPFYHAISHQRKGWRVPLRFARNLVRSFSGVQISPTWQALAASPAQIYTWSQSRCRVLCLCRNAGFYEYVLRCPTAECRLFSVRQADRVEGYFCLSSVPGQARIAEMCMESDDPAVWAIGYVLASREGAALGAAEIVGASSSQTGWEALTAAGYEPCQTIPIMARASTGVTLPVLPMQMVDSDGFFLHHGRPEYMS